MGLKNTMCPYLSTEYESSKWHALLGHINFETIKSMIQKVLVFGILKFNIEKEVCGSCLLGKARLTFPKATSYRATKQLEMIHGDLYGPITPNTLACNKYIFVIVDDDTRYI